MQVIAAAFNHRDLFQRQSLYPGTIFSTSEQASILGADGAGILLSRGHPLSGQAVLIAPAVNWLSSPWGPEDPGKKPFGILGSVKQVRTTLPLSTLGLSSHVYATQTEGRGTFAQYIVVGKDDVVACPKHFLNRGMEGWSEAAATPLGALTAYR